MTDLRGASVTCAPSSLRSEAAQRVVFSRRWIHVLQVAQWWAPQCLQPSFPVGGARCEVGRASRVSDSCIQIRERVPLRLEEGFARRLFVLWNARERLDGRCRVDWFGRRISQHRSSFARRMMLGTDCRAQALLHQRNPISVVAGRFWCRRAVDAEWRRTCTSYSCSQLLPHGFDQQRPGSTILGRLLRDPHEGRPAAAKPDSLWRIPTGCPLRSLHLSGTSRTL